MKTVLITGGAGYLGGRLFEALSKSSEFKVILGVRNPSLIRSYPEFAHAELRYLDMLDYASFGAALKGVDVVIHLAALNAQDCEKNPDLAIKVNHIATKDFAKRALELGVKQFIYFSTAHVYGKMVGEITENSSTNPLNVYSQTHLDAENEVLKLQSESFKVVVLRLSNSIGYPLNKEANCWMLIGNDLCRQAISFNRLLLKTAGEDYRNFISIYEIERILLIVIGDNKAYFKSGVFNLGGADNCSIFQLAGIIAKCFEKLDGRELIIERNLDVRLNKNELALFYSVEKIQNCLCYQSFSNLEYEIENALRKFKTWFA